jgi:hypothetical protein
MLFGFFPIATQPGKENNHAPLCKCPEAISKPGDEGGNL